MPLLKGFKKLARRDFSGDPDEFRLTLVEHLEELRDRVIRSLLILGVFWVGAWYATETVYEYLEASITRSILAGLPPGHEFKQVMSNMADAFFLHFRLSFALALIPAIPLIVLQLWAFIAPGLRPSEQRPFRALAPWSLVLFAMGAGFAWFITPMALTWFVSYFGEFRGVALHQQAGTMTFFILKMLAAFGIAFQLPLVVYVLGALELLSAETLIKYWRQSAVGIFVVAMLITPSNDPASMITMAIPLVILFSISVYAVKVMQRKRQKTREAEEAHEEERETDTIFS